MSEIRQKAVAGIVKGDRFIVTRTITRKDIVDFAKVTKDYNPVHFDDRFAKVKKFDGTISHGLLAASLLTEIGGQIGWLATEMNFQFKKPVYTGDTICCEMVITDVDDAGFACAKAVITNVDSAVVIESVLKGLLPRNPEKEVLRNMIAEGDLSNTI
jgi:3-hydroxybutyryl-CoA dehydratase